MPDCLSGMKQKASQMLAEGKVKQVLAWKEGVLPHLPEPAFFTNEEEIDGLTYTKFCGANLSKFLIGNAAGHAQGKTLAFLRFCDTYSFNLLLQENRVNREDVYIAGIGCLGIYDENDKLLEACGSCTKTKHVVYDELMFDELHPLNEQANAAKNFEETVKSIRFSQVEKIENLTADEKYAFWQKELSRCIRCNACRNICPTCHCKKCVFDSDKYDAKQNVNVSSFEEQMFHIIRAYHIAGRCTDCGQCSRVCPQKIPLYILNRKFIKDINTFFGEYNAGEDAKTLNPLVSFNAGSDPEV